MSFGLKNSRASYRIIMNKVFTKQIGRNMEVYVNDILVFNNPEELQHNYNHNIIRKSPNKITNNGKSPNKITNNGITLKSIESAKLYSCSSRLH